MKYETNNKEKVTKKKDRRLMLFFSFLLVPFAFFVLGCHRAPSDRLDQTQAGEKKESAQQKKPDKVRKPVRLDHSQLNPAPAVKTTKTKKESAQKNMPDKVKGQVRLDHSQPNPTPAAKTTKTKLGKNIWLEVQGKRRRVLVGAAVCLREGSFGLECLMCRKGTKEYESILATDADARTIHAALELTGAKPGSPVKFFEDRVVPPKGSHIKVSLQYVKNGHIITLPAQKWILNVTTKKDLDLDWVFAGSQLVPNKNDKGKPPVYQANDDGSYVCVSNNPFAMLDLPFNSPKNPDSRVFQCHTARIPAIGTSVTVIFEPEPARGGK